MKLSEDPPRNPAESHPAVELLVARLRAKLRVESAKIKTLGDEFVEEAQSKINPNCEICEGRGSILDIVAYANSPWREAYHLCPICFFPSVIKAKVRKRGSRWQVRWPLGSGRPVLELQSWRDAVEYAVGHYEVRKTI